MKTTFAIVISLFVCLTHTAGLGYISSDGILAVVHSDDFGSVIAITEDNNVIFTANYGPHGEDWGSTGTNPTPFTWLGGYGVQTLNDGTPLKMYLTRHRLYSATLNRFLSADPLGIEGGFNLYQYGEGNPMAYIDPLGLCTSSSGFNLAVQFGDTKIGRGEPSLIFTSDSWGDLGRGTLSAIDGIIPFANPFASYYANPDGSVNSEYLISRQIAGISRDILVSAAIPNIGTYLQHPVKYEIGQMTIQKELYLSLQHLTPVERGAALIQKAGGWWKVGGLSAPGQFINTLGTGLTPGGYLLSIGTLEYFDVKSR